MTPRTLTPAAIKVIKAVNVAANHPVEPHAALQDITRATTIFGRLLEKIADDNFDQASPIARNITRLGLAGYSLVELSVPKSLWNLAFHYWNGLLRLVGIITFVLGIFFKSEETWLIGLAIILITWILGSLSDAARRFMQHRPFSLLYGLKQFSTLLIVLCLCVLLFLFRQDVGEGLIEAGQAIRNIELPW